MKSTCALCQPRQDEQIVIQSEKWRVIFVDTIDYPGFCRVIWMDHVAEMTDLPERDRQEMMNVVLSVEQAVRDVMRPDKVNLASLGNMVPHLHWHVIPRFSDDAHFPESIWGEKQREPDVWVLEKRRALLPELKAAIRRILE
ncbi:MAG: HIT family protein [Betaproteobacteria bacterium]|nr:HIT family protein [Betaproteobacteria bacterium]